MKPSKNPRNLKKLTTSKVEAVNYKALIARCFFRAAFEWLFDEVLEGYCPGVAGEIRALLRHKDG